MSDTATIYALASGAGRAGVAIIRLSGERAGAALEALTQQPLPEPRHAAMRRFSEDGAVLDDGLALWFPRPASFTGEDVVELHVHGGAAVIAAVVEALSRLPGLRPARAGEFTRRAFENGKLDLTAAEGLADLVDAETQGQRAQALRQMEGGLAALYDGWRTRLIQALALLEAEIDFPDEDLPGQLAARAQPLIAVLAAEMETHLSDAHRGERVRDGYRVAILGAPNAGKSSLLNALARREAAIVSDIPGTTRDVVEARLILGGFPVWIADTAGLRAARDVIEAEGVRRALERAAESDLRIGVVDGSGNAIDAETRDALRTDDVLVLSKSDLKRGAIDVDSCGFRGVSISTKTGEGVADLERVLTEIVTRALDKQEAPALTRARHRALVEEAHAALTRAGVSLEQGPELAAEDLRLAGRSLARLTGTFDVELVLDEIFGQFCIGK